MGYDIKKFAALFALVGLVGFLSGYFMALMLIASIALIVWLLYRLELLYRWVLNPSVEPMPEQNGQIYKLHRELHRRFADNRRQKKKLRNYLNQFRKVASVLPDAIVLLDEMGKIEWANLNASQLLGIDWPRDSGLRFIDLIRESNAVELVSNEINPQRSIVLSLPVHRQRTINMKCARFTDTSRMIIARDVTELLAINKLQADFVANVSHELKTPLTVIRGYLEIMNDHPKLDETLSKPLQQMVLHSERMQLIVHDLLCLAKLEDYGNKSEHKVVDITHLVNSVVESIQPAIENKRHKLELNIDYGINILGNQSELFSALSNLIVNAVKYSESNSLISIAWERDRNGATLLVKDNGLGIPANEIANLTKRFYRVDEDRSRESGGTGIGLAIVKHVLQRHNAKLEIDSLIGVGSEFRCVFPEQQLSRNNVQKQQNV